MSEEGGRSEGGQGGTLGFVYVVLRQLEAMIGKTITISMHKVMHKHPLITKS